MVQAPVLISSNALCFFLMPVLYKHCSSPGFGAEQILQQGFLQISLEVYYLQTIHPWPRHPSLVGAGSGARLPSALEYLDMGEFRAKANLLAFFNS